MSGRDFQEQAFRPRFQHKVGHYTIQILLHPNFIEPNELCTKQRLLLAMQEYRRQSNTAGLLQYFFGFEMEGGLQAVGTTATPVVRKMMGMAGAFFRDQWLLASRTDAAASQASGGFFYTE